MLESFRRRLAAAFETPDRRAAHAAAGPVLAEMAADPRVLHAILRENLQKADFAAQLRINPVIAIKVSEDAQHTLIAHLWFPLDDARTDLTHQSVHHHGNLLLTSVSAWGNGYESVLFKPGFAVDGPDGETRMEIDKIYRNPRGHLEFIGTHTPHVVFFPRDFTVTYALWSGDRRQAGGAIKRLPWVQTYKKTLKRALTDLGLAGRLGLNLVEYLDFYPRDGRLIQMKERVQYRQGTAANYLQNFFWVLQQTGFDDLDCVRAVAARTPAAVPWLGLLEKGAPIPREMERIHLGVERVQFGRTELLACFPAEPGGARAADATLVGVR